MEMRNCKTGNCWRPSALRRTRLEQPEAKLSLKAVVMVDLLAANHRLKARLLEV